MTEPPFEPCGGSHQARVQLVAFLVLRKRHPNGRIARPAEPLPGEDGERLSQFETASFPLIVSLVSKPDARSKRASPGGCASRNRFALLAISQRVYAVSSHELSAAVLSTTALASSPLCWLSPNLMLRMSARNLGVARRHPFGRSISSVARWSMGDGSG
jgi:hypothetical protein